MGPNLSFSNFPFGFYLLLPTCIEIEVKTKIEIPVKITIADRICIAHVYFRVLDPHIPPRVIHDEFLRSI